MPVHFSLAPLVAGAATLLALIGLRLADPDALTPLRALTGAAGSPALLEAALALATGAAVTAYFARRDTANARRAMLVSLLVIAGTAWSAATRGVPVDFAFQLLALAATSVAAALGLRLDRHRARRHLRRTFAGSLSRPHLAALPDAPLVPPTMRDVTVLHAACDHLFAGTDDAAPAFARAARVLGPLAGRLRETGAFVTTDSDGSLTAVWNAPLAQPDHASRAGRTALGVRPLADSLAISLADGTAAPAFRLGIGIASGRALTGSLGSTASPTYAVIGDVQSEARRLQRDSLASGMPILVSTATARAATDLATLTFLPGSLILMGDETVARAREFRALKPLLAEIEANLKINAQSDVAALLDELGKRHWPALWPPLALLLAYYRQRAEAPARPERAKSASAKPSEFGRTSL